MRSLVLVLVMVPNLALCGCYYGHLASGQLRVLWQRQPIEKARVDPAHPEDVRALLGLVESVRRFARELGLSVDDQYTSYVDWPGDRMVTTIVRTRAGSLESVPWWFPMVGHLPYKGYFDRARAEAEAERLTRSGEYDVCVSGVAAYSTLGWLDDPVTQPMLRRGAASLVETLLHELVHATAFLAGEADFNEGVAQFIGQQAAIRFFEQAERSAGANEIAGLPSSERVEATIADRWAIARWTIAFKDRVATLEKRPDRAAVRAKAETEARAELAKIPLRVLEAEKVAIAARLSDACLALRGTYIRDLPRHARVLASLDGDLNAMIERLRLWADESRSSADFFVDRAARSSDRAQMGPAQ
ncbi:MAG: aminopeptidase [bacterium]|nr:aminopeptidase [bacterium]